MAKQASKGGMGKGAASKTKTAERKYTARDIQEGLRTMAALVESGRRKVATPITPWAAEIAEAAGLPTMSDKVRPSHTPSTLALHPHLPFSVRFSRPAPLHRSL